MRVQKQKAPVVSAESLWHRIPDGGRKSSVPIPAGVCGGTGISTLSRTNPTVPSSASPAVPNFLHTEQLTESIAPTPVISMVAFTVESDADE